MRSAICLRRILRIYFLIILPRIVLTCIGPHKKYKIDEVDKTIVYRLLKAIYTDLLKIYGRLYKLYKIKESSNNKNGPK